jgi:hypothetical protein
MERHAPADGSHIDKGNVHHRYVRLSDYLADVGAHCKNGKLYNGAGEGLEIVRSRAVDPDSEVIVITKEREGAGSTESPDEGN